MVWYGINRWLKQDSSLSVFYFCVISLRCVFLVTSLTNFTLFLSDLQSPMALEALSHQQQQQQQQAARLGHWGEAARPFLQGNVAFPLPQQLAHLAQSGMARFPPQLLRAATWGHSANMDDEAVPTASTGPNFNRLDLTLSLVLTKELQ